MKKFSFVFLSIFILILIAGCCSTKTISNPKDISTLAVEEFLLFTEIPRPSYSTDKALTYLEAFADRHGLEHYRDYYGNFWMDIPATQGFENYPKVILQAHMDMVCAAETGVDIDFKKTAITAIVNKEEKTITAKGTSLGADNGIGVGIILAIAESDCAHGPVRALITTDEDVGLLGAEQLDSRALDSDYLINIDNETAGEIIYSSAGTLRFLSSKQYSTTTSDKTMYTLSIDGLKGGHSGTDIGKNRLSSVVVLSRILARYESEGIEIRMGEIKAGDAFNAIARYANATFASDATEKKLVSLASEVLEDFKQSYPDETVVCTLAPSSLSGTVIDLAGSRELIKVMSSFPQGVLKMSKTTKGLVQTSNNIGTVTLVDGFMKIMACSRSCVTPDLENLYGQFTKLSADNGYEFDKMSMYPGWDGNPQAPLLLLSERAFDSIGIKAEAHAIHAGLECAWFVDRREGLQIISLGPTIENCHTPNETLHIDSVEPTVNAILYCLEHINEI